MVGAFLIFLREGIEASMIVAILLAYVRRSGRGDLERSLGLGVALALLLALVGGVAIYTVIKTGYVGSTAQTVFEGVTYLAAVIVLTYMTFWMKTQARDMKKALQQRVDTALVGGSRLAMMAIGFLSVGREGLETVVFTIAIAFQSSPVQMAAGALLGSAVAMVMAAAMYRWGRRINLRTFFTVMGVCLMLFAAGLLANTVQNFQHLGWLPLFGQPIWNSAALLGEGTTLGDVLHAFFGYAERPSALQVVAYLTYLSVVCWFFLGPGARRRPHLA